MRRLWAYRNCCGAPLQRSYLEDIFVTNCLGVGTRSYLSRPRSPPPRPRHRNLFATARRQSGRPDILASQHGKIVRSCRNQMKFPFIQPKRGQDVPRGSSYYKGPHSQGTVSDFRECVADVWIEVQRGERAPNLYEQIYSQQNGFGLIMLHLEKRDEEEEAEDRDLERRWEARFRK